MDSIFSIRCVHAVNPHILLLSVFPICLVFLLKLDLLGRSNDIFCFFKRSALSHMRPMSLSLTSPDRPASLSHNVLEEIENFLHSVVRWDLCFTLICKSLSCPLLLWSWLSGYSYLCISLWNAIYSQFSWTSYEIVSVLCYIVNKSVPGKAFDNHICASEFLFRYEGSIQPESLKILLEYTLTRGNLTSIFKVLKLLYGKGHKSIAHNIYFLIITVCISQTSVF